MIRTTKAEIEKAITEIVEYATQYEIDLSEIDYAPDRFPTFKEFLLKRKINEVVERLKSQGSREYFVEMVVFAKSIPKVIIENQMLLEWERYKNIPKTSYTYRYDSGNTNTKTQDHIHVYADGNQLYAINKDGSTHDGSKAKIGKKEIKFLKNMGFNVPQDGLLEWRNLENEKIYQAINLELLFG